MRALVRVILLIPIAYIAACVAAGVTAVISVHGFADDPDFAMEGFVLAGGIIAGMYFGVFAVVPALALIVLAEVFGWRSFLVHVLVGGGIILGVMLPPRCYAEPSGRPGRGDAGLRFRGGRGVLADRGAPFRTP